MKICTYIFIIIISISSCGVSKDTLFNVTSDYEKRLENKDKQIKALNEQINFLQKRINQKPELKKVTKPKEYKGVYSEVQNIQSSNRFIRCDLTFLEENFRENCLYRLITVRMLDYSQLANELRNLKSDIFVVENNKLFIVYLDLNTFNNYSNSLERTFPDGYKQCNFSIQSKNYNRGIIRNSLLEVEDLTTRDAIEVESTKYDDNRIYYCDNHAISYKYLKNPIQGEYLQLAVVKTFECNNFGNCDGLKNLILVDYDGDKKDLNYRVLIGATSRMSEIRKCAGFEDIIRVTY